MGPTAGREGMGQKGGWLTCRTGGAELSDQQAEGAVGVAEALGDFLLRPSLDEDGAEGFILALPGAGGFEEEAEGEGIVHGRGPAC